MPFTTSPISGPLPVQSTTTSSAAQLAARAAAIARLTGGASPNAQPTDNAQPVPNASKVAPEEMGAVAAPTAETTGQTQNTVEDETPTEAATVQKEAPLSAQYAQLARREKQIRAQVNSVKAQQAALKAREDALTAKEAEMQSQFIPKDRIAKDPMQVLADAGYTAQQITDMLLNAPDPATTKTRSEIEELRAEVKALKDGQETSKKTFQENQTQSYQEALNQMRIDTQELVDSDPAYEMIKNTNSVSDVVDLIEKTYRIDKKLLTVERAAKEVETYLAEEAVKLARLGKVQAMLNKTPKATGGQTQQTKTKTLNNTMGVNRPLSAKERAILAFKGQLK